MTDNELRNFWSKYFNFNWRFGLFLIAIVCIPRFLLVLKINQTGNYAPLGAIMILLAIVPFIFLNKHGRNKIGLKKTKKWGKLILSLLLGVIFSLVIGYIGTELYGNSNQNWYQYIGRSYNIPEAISANDKLALFAMMAGTGMVFSPIGEELFFRGSSTVVSRNPSAKKRHQL